MAKELQTTGQTTRVLSLDLQPIVEITNGAIARRHRGRCNDEDVFHVGPKQSRHEYAEQDERSAHRRCTRLLLVPLGILLTNDLAYLLSAKGTDEPRRDEEGQQHRGERCHNRAEGLVTKNVEDTGPTELRT
ncbi:MAG: hypothetical protein QM784_01710 [Polyangiaceae bacterium]